jgi:hypothetical protein
MNERLEELKAKAKSLGGYLGLPKEEQTEYTALKKDLDSVTYQTQPTGSPVFSEGAKKLAEDDRITRLEKMVENLSKENSNLREETAKIQEGWGDYVAPKDQNKTATIKIYRKDSDSPAGVIVKAVVFKNNDWDEETHKFNKLVYTVTLRYDDGTTEDVKLGAMELADLREIEKVEIIKEERRTLRKVEDYVPMPDRDKAGFPKRILDGGSGYGKSVGKGQIPLEVFKVESTVTIRRKNGQEFQMENSNLNL